MNASSMEQLLREIGFNYLRVVNTHDDTNFLFCCPWHGERHPSCGISANKEIGACFACGQKFSLAYLVAYMKNCSMKRATEWLEEKFNVTKQQVDTRKKTYYYDSEEAIEEKKHKRVVIPNLKLAPYRSGKVTHKYLLDRGFTSKTFQRFKFGWDREKQRITIPIFWEDDTLAGFLGRSVLEPKIAGKDNPEYKAVYGDRDKYLVYEFEKSKILYPLQMFDLPESKTAILVEGSLDAVWLHQQGFSNALALLGSKISRAQIEILGSLGVKRVILMLDNDKAGDDGKEYAYTLMKNDFLCQRVTFPEGKNDPQELSVHEISHMIDNAKPFKVLQVKRIE